MDAEIDKFRTVSKRILKEKLSEVPTTLVRYKQDIIKAYATFVTFCASIYKDAEGKDKDTIINALNYISKKFEDCLIKLNCKYNLSGNLFDLPDPNTIQIIGIEIPVSPLPNPIQPPLSLEVALEQTDTTMSDLSPSEFLRLCANTINYTFSGEPTGLSPFINAIQLLETMATNAPLKQILVSFLKTKLVGKAGEALGDDTNTLDDIKNKLKAKIKPESSKVLEGRLAALKLDRQPIQDFAKKAEELADDLQRSLVMEGIPTEKANEMTIEKTVRMCRASARTDLVKSILASTKFDAAKEAISKLIVETNVQIEERQILAFRSTNKRGNGHSSNANRQQNNNNNNRNSNSGYNRQRNNSQNGQSNRQSYNNSRSNNSRAPRNNNNNNNRGNNRSNNGGRTYYNSNNQNGHGNPSVRVISGNDRAPTHNNPESEDQFDQL